MRLQEYFLLRKEISRDFLKLASDPGVACRTNSLEIVDFHPPHNGMLSRFFIGTSTRLSFSIASAGEIRLRSRSA